MPTDVIMPALGLAQETGKILRWLRSDGDEVSKGDPLMEVETDKVTVEIEAPAGGRLAVRASEGDEIAVGAPVGLVLAPGEEAAEAAAPAAQEASVAQATAPARVAASPPPPAAAREGRTLASPKARRLAAERGIDLASAGGTGPGGTVVARDVAALAGDGAAAAGAPAVPAAQELSVGAVWTRMAERMVESWQSAPHFFLVREVDATRLLAWRESLRDRPGYEGVTHTDLLVKVCAAALREHPRVNASWHDGSIVAAADVNVGIAVAVDDGLVVPVVHGADALPLQAIAARRKELVEAARRGGLRPGDVTGGTFTLSNLGMYGVDAFAAIVNPPQAAILAVGRIADRVLAVGGTPEVRPTMVLTLSLDHRTVDGAHGARFVDTLAGLVEEPARLVP